jgi:cytoskeletal protein RodZ
VGAFGEKLRKQREQRGIELDAISNTTKIGTRMLRALEEEHFDQLPGGVFNKGFVRAYARHVGLDEEEAVADYLAALRESQIQAVQIMPNLRGKPGNSSEVPAESFREVSQRGESSRSPQFASAQVLADNPPAERFTKKYPAGIVPEARGESSRPVPWAKLAVIVLLMILTLAFWGFRHRRKVAAAVQPANYLQESSHVDSKKAAEPDSSAPVGAASYKPPAPTATAASPPKPSSAAAPSPAPEPGPAKRAVNPISADVATVGSQSKTAAVSESSPTLHLQIRATETSWVSIIADGNPVAHETLIAPASTSVRATREIVVKTGNAAGVSFLLNGKEIPVQGNEGEVKSYTFDASGLREPTP